MANSDSIEYVNYVNYFINNEMCQNRNFKLKNYCILALGSGQRLL